MRLFFVALSLSMVGLLTACEGSDPFRVDPNVVVDTVTLAAPAAAGDTLPSLLDVLALTGRFPGNQGTALEWDLALRVRDGALTLVPASAFEFPDRSGRVSRAAITPPLSETFDGLEHAPVNSLADTAVVIEPGAVYAVRSRVSSCGYGSGFRYAKLQALDVDPEQGQLQLRVATNQVCGDPRLVDEE